MLTKAGLKLHIDQTHSRKLMLGKQKYIKGCKSDPVNDLLCEREEQSLNLLCERVLIVKMSSVPLFLKDPNDCTIANFYNSLTFDDLKLGGKG